MNRKFTKETAAFSARSKDGTEYTILEFTDFVEICTRGGCEVQPEARRLRTSKGEHVNPVEKGKYRIVGLVAIDLVSDDPNAP
ncbi:MAG: hypothetical protein ABSF26_16855 [Thermoguttaceae bacterium]|jgi:hypothetical protein